MKKFFAKSIQLALVEDDKICKIETDFFFPNIFDQASEFLSEKTTKIFSPVYLLKPIPFHGTIADILYSITVFR